MATIKKFEDLKIWQDARVLCRKIHEEISSNENFYRDFALRDQIKRSSGSIMDNITEGFDRNGRREFIQFLSIAKASNSEVKSQLYRALDYQYISEKNFKALYIYTDEIGKMIGGFIKYLKTSDYKGSKFEEPIEKYNTFNSEL